MDELAVLVEANIARIEGNFDVIAANLKIIKSARWRLFRNRRLLDRNWELVNANRLLFTENNGLLIRRQRHIDAHRA